MKMQRLKRSWPRKAVGLVALYPLLIAAHPVDRLSPDSLLGTWINESSQIRGVAELMIRYQDGHTFVHAWARCDPIDCDWGEVESKLQNGIPTAAWNQGLISRFMQLIPQPDGRLLVNYKSEFHDSSGRLDPGHAEFFAPDRDQQARPQVSGSGTPGEIYRTGEDISPPVLIRRVEPQYSEEARRAMVSGSVLLLIVVDVNGVPGDIRVVRSPGLELDKMAIEAVSKWRFHPGTIAATPVPAPCWAQVDFRFSQSKSFPSAPSSQTALAPVQLLIQNVSPEEISKRILRSVLPEYPEFAKQAHITGTVDVALGISPEGDVSPHSRVLIGLPLLAAAAKNAMLQWKFQPNIVNGQPTFSRVRALVRFNPDGSTEIAFARAILPDSFGDPGTPRNPTAEASQPAVIHGEAPRRRTLCEEIGRGETSAASYTNERLGLAFQFPSNWRPADPASLAAIEGRQAAATRSRYDTGAPNVTLVAMPSCLLFSSTMPEPNQSQTTISIWAERELLIHTGDQYFRNKPYLYDRTAAGTRGPEPVEINGTTFSRGDRWGTVNGRTVYQSRLVTPVRDLMLGIDITGESKPAVDRVLKTLGAFRIAQAPNQSTISH